jgi:hypothetical protein
VKAPKMKKVPSALKWLAEKRARVAGDLATCMESNELISAHVDVLQRELASAQGVLAASSNRKLKLTAELSALDQTVKIYDDKIQPELIAPINGWRGRYGQRGALREFLIKTLRELGHASVSTTELALLAIVEFALHFDTKHDRKRWYDNSFRRQLKNLRGEGFVESLEDPLSVVRGWRWKQEEAKTLAGLQNPVNCPD